MVRLLFLYYSIWQNPKAGKMKRILCSDWLPGRARWARLSSAFFPPLSLSLFLAKLVRSRLLDIGLFLSLSLFFCVFIDVLSSSRSIKTRKRTWPIPSHLSPYASHWRSPIQSLEFTILAFHVINFRFCEHQMRGVEKEAFVVPMHLVFRVLYVGKRIWTCPVQTRMPRQEAILERRIEGGQL